MSQALTTDADKARAIQDAAGELARSLKLSNNQWNCPQQDRMIALCNAVIAMIDDGDCMAERDNLVWEHENTGYAADTFWRDSHHAINAGLAA